MTYRECYDRGAAVLKEAGIEEADLDARLLLEYVCATSRNDLLVHGERQVEESQADRYGEMLARRASRIPLQHLTGVQAFMGLEFLVDRRVLIPRQDTELLVEEALKHIHDGMQILDLCTGSGCILISLLHYSNDCTGVGVDISPKALEIARENAGRLLGEAGETPGRIVFLLSDLLDKVEGMYDMVVSNPPYIPEGMIASLMPEVRDHEPVSALDGGGDGLVFYRRILAGAGSCLKKGGMLFFEIGYDQAEAVSFLMEEAGFLEVQVVKDYAGLNRVVYGTLGFSV